MCRSCHLRPSFSFSRMVKLVHTYCRCPDVVTAACTFRHLCGAGSIPAWGSAKTNEEVLELLLTWSDYPRKFLVVKAGGETCRLCFMRQNIATGYTCHRRVVAKEIWLIAQSGESGTEMCRSCHLRPFRKVTASTYTSQAQTI